MRPLTLPRRIGLLEERCDHARNQGNRKRTELLCYGLSLLHAEQSAMVFATVGRFARNLHGAFSRN